MITKVDPNTYEEIGDTAPSDQEIWFGIEEGNDSYNWTINGEPYITEAGGDYTLWHDGCFVFKEEVSGESFQVNCTPEISETMTVAPTISPQILEVKQLANTGVDLNGFTVLAIAIIIITLGLSRRIK